MKYMREWLLVATMVLAGTASSAQEDPAKLLKEIAAARAVAEVDGELDKAEEALAGLATRVEKLGVKEGAEVRLQLATTRALVLERLGRLEEAATMLESEQGLNVDAMRLRGYMQSHGVKPEAESLASVVRDYVYNDDWNRLETIGSPAAEFLPALALETAGALPERNDILYWFLRIDEAAAVRFLIAHFDAGGPLWKRRVLQGLTKETSLHDDGTWTRNEPYLCLEPDLLKLLALLLSYPETATGTLPLLTEVMQFDALTKEQVSALVNGIRSGRPEFAMAVLQLFDADAVPESSQPILEALLASSESRVRRVAASKLSVFERSEPLLARVGDPDPAVRWMVASVLGAHGGLMIRQGKDQEEAKWSRQIQGPDVALLRKLLADTDEEVRRIAVRKLDELATPLEPGVYDALTRDPAVTVRSELLNLWPLPTELRSALLATLARDSSPNVASRVDNVLSNVQGEEFTLDPGPYLPAIETRWKELEPELRRTLTINLVRSSSGLRTLAGLLLASGDPAAVQELNRYASAADLLRLPDEHLARVLMTSDRAREGPWDNLWQAIQESEPRRTAAMRLLLANEQASRPVRLQAAVLASDGTQTYRDGLLAFLALPMWKQQPIAEKERKQMRWAAERLGKDERCAMALIVVRDAKLDFDVATTFVGGNYPLDAAKSEELTKAVLERWFRPEVPENAPVWRALEHLGSLADPAWHPVLERALLDPAYAYQALRSVAAKRDASFLPLVARGLRAEWVPLAERDDVQVEAAQALASFNDPAAAQYLIEGLRSPYEEVRDQCRMGLERLEEYETHARAWKDRGRAAPTKESTLAELVTMLDEKDPAIRRQAALGIATLGAIELIPQLIRLTKDADASVSQAAQKALDRLNEARPADTQEGG